MHKEIMDVTRTHYVTIPTDLKNYSFNPGLEGDGYNRAQTKEMNNHVRSVSFVCVL